MNPSEKDPALNAALREWKQDAPLPPRFRENVWNRIEKMDAPVRLSVTSRVAQWLTQISVRPALAAAYVALLLATGMTAGYLQAQQKQNRINQHLGARYVQSIDPYQKIAASK